MNGEEFRMDPDDPGDPAAGLGVAILVTLAVIIAAVVYFCGFKV